MTKRRLPHTLETATVTALKTGYFDLYWPDHPLARANGCVRRHRAMLYDHLSRPDTSDCHWCGWTLPWIIVPRDQRQVICADHLNGVKGDDRPDNLAPACYWCNLNRSIADIAPLVWHLCIRWLVDTHPTNRPAAITILGNLVGIDHFDGESLRIPA